MLEVNNNLLERSIDNNTLSHAYMFETDYCDDNMSFIYNFVESIFTKGKSVDEANIIKERINSGNFPELKIIKRDGQNIKKEQILELKDDFSSDAFEGNIRVYIIYEAEKMNASSSNTLLKFLEEPDGNIVGILLTSNTHLVLDTLISRCQVVSIKKSTEIILSENYDLIVSFLHDTITLKSGVYGIVHNYDKLFENKDAAYDTLKNILIILSDIMYSKIKGKYKYIVPNDNIVSLSSILDYNDLAHKINVINDLYDMLNYNINLQLLLDRFIILMSGGVSSDSTS